jgi:hypothetical protein
MPILISPLINRNMVNKTRKIKELSLDTLKKLAHKYIVTESGSKKQIALRLWKLEKHVMSSEDLKTIEDFLKLAPAKRYKGTRYGRKKNGTLYCISSDCDPEDLK